MGQLLSIFSDGETDCNCISPQNGANLFINFVNAQPTESEKETYDEAEEFIKDSENFIEQLKSFKGMYLNLPFFHTFFSC